MGPTDRVKVSCLFVILLDVFCWALIIWGLQAAFGWDLPLIGE